MARVRLFGPARDEAGTGRDEIDGDDVAAVLDAACERYGPGFADVLRSSAVWLNGEEAPGDRRVMPGDELAVLPPVSGG